MYGLAIQGRRPRGVRTTFTPFSLALTFMPMLARYCSRPRASGSPSLALLAAKHCEGMPRKLSLARLTSVYALVIAAGAQAPQAMLAQFAPSMLIFGGALVYLKHWTLKLKPPRLVQVKHKVRRFFWYLEYCTLNLSPSILAP